MCTLLIFYNIYSFVNGHDGFQTVRDYLVTLHYTIFVAQKTSTFLLLVESICKSRWSRGLGLRQFPCWDGGFEFHRSHESLSLVCVVCYQVEFFASG